MPVIEGSGVAPKPSSTVVDHTPGTDIWDSPRSTSSDSGGSGSSGSSSGSSGGSTSTSTGGGGTTKNYDGPGKDYNDEDKNARFLGVGGHPEVWKDSTTGQVYLVYFASGTEPPVPLLYETTVDALEGFFGEGNKVIYDKTLSTAEVKSVGAVKFGSTDNLTASEGDPWLGFLDRVERLKEVSPWANDDEMLAIIGGAYLESREVYEWEWEGTTWWKEHNEEERAWLEMQMGDPSSASKKLGNDQAYVRRAFEAIGAAGNDPTLINWMALQYSTGNWSESELNAQVEAVTSGWGEMNDEMANWMETKGDELDIASSEVNHNRVKELFSRWL